MAERLINVDRATPMLLPPDLRDWVAGNDLALLILEAVELCDLRGAARNVRGSGSAQYPPGMMVALLLYGYASGTFSSRRIERATDESVAVRYLCANHHPDHDTIAHFRRQNGGLFARCFATVVQLAREAGLLRLAAISLDGTRLAGAASKNSVRTLGQIEAELRELESQGASLLGQAEAADRRDADAGGTQLPPELADAQARREKLLGICSLPSPRCRHRHSRSNRSGKPRATPHLLLCSAGLFSGIPFGTPCVKQPDEQERFRIYRPRKPIGPAGFTPARPSPHFHARP
jgi:transposase